MLHRWIDHFLEGQHWMDPLGDVLQKIPAAIYRGELGRRLKSFLNGTWLGHGLHPVLTDIPIGAWTLAVLFDIVHLFDRRSDVWVTGAEVLVGVGLLAALGAWVTGYTDWSDTDARTRERRFGLAHGLLNSLVIILYAISFLLRLPVGGHGAAIVISWIGYALLTTAAYLGGELVINIGWSVNHHAWQTPPTAWTAALRESALAEGKLQMAYVEGTPILLYKHAGTVYAIGNTCSHAAAPLNEGQIEGDVVICPYHASRFDIRTGAVKGGPATVPQVRYETRIQGEQVEVRRSADSLQPS